MARRAITERTAEEILERVDNMTAPGHLTTHERWTMLTELRAEISTRIEALDSES